MGQLTYDPAKVVKLVGEEVTAPRHLDDQEEQALVAAAKKKGSARDQAIIVLMLHTGLRAREVHMGEQRKLSRYKEEKYALMQSIFLGNLHLAGKRQERKLYRFQGKGLPHGGEKPS